MKWYPLPVITLSQVFLHVLCSLILTGAGFRGAIRKMWKWRENWCCQDHLCLTDKCFRWYFWRFSDCKWCLISACHGCAGAIHTRPRQDFQRRARWWRWATSHREYIVKNPLDIKNTLISKILVWAWIWLSLKRNIVDQFCSSFSVLIFQICLMLASVPG